MQLTMIDGSVCNATISRFSEKPDPKLIARVLVEDHNLSPAIALAISTGALLRRNTTIALARQYGLIAADVLTDARIAGLVS